MIYILYCSTGSDNEISIVPATTQNVAVGTSIYFTCQRKLEGTVLGWRVEIYGTKHFLMSQNNRSTNLGLNISFPFSDVTTLQFIVASNGVVAVECQYIELEGGYLIKSQSVSITIVGK